MSDTKRFLFLIDDDFNGYNTINDCIRAWCKEHDLSTAVVLQQLYIDFNMTCIDRSYYDIYKIVVKHRNNSRGFEVYYDVSDTKTVSAITGNIL